jgi:hypothetical protein
MCVSYSALVRSPDQLATILSRAGVAVTGSETSFHERMDTSEIRGDRSFATNPRPLSTESEKRRGEEMAALIDKVKSSKWIDPMQEFVAAIDQLSAQAAIPAEDPSVAEIHALLKLFGSELPAPAWYPKPAQVLPGRRKSTD